MDCCRDYTLHVTGANSAPGNDEMETDDSDSEAETKQSDLRQSSYDLHYNQQTYVKLIIL